LFNFRFMFNFRRIHGTKGMLKSTEIASLATTKFVLNFFMYINAVQMPKSSFYKVS